MEEVTGQAEMNIPEHTNLVTAHGFVDIVQALLRCLQKTDARNSEMAACWKEYDRSRCSIS